MPLWLRVKGKFIRLWNKCKRTREPWDFEDEKEFWEEAAKRGETQPVAKEPYYAVVQLASGKVHGFIPGRTVKKLHRSILWLSPTAWERLSKKPI